MTGLLQSFYKGTPFLMYFLSLMKKDWLNGSKVFSFGVDAFYRREKTFVAFSMFAVSCDRDVPIKQIMSMKGEQILSFPFRIDSFFRKGAKN